MASEHGSGVGMPTRKTILFIGTVPPPITGQSLACAVFLQELAKHYDVRVININKSDLASGGFVWGRVKEIVGILRQVRREADGVDGVYFTITESILGNAKDLLIYLACRRLLPNTVVHLHGGAGMIRLLHGPVGVIRRLNAAFLRRMAAVIVLGDRLRRVYDGVIAPDTLRVVENFAEQEYQLPAELVRAKFLERGRLRVLFLSNMIAEKGYLLLRDAAHALERDYPGAVQLDFAGAFVTEDDKADFLASIVDRPYIRYHGVVNGERKKQLLQQAHVLALPTYYPFEGQPISILEGYAAGCAVLTTDHSGIFDIFTPGENGWEVEKRSVDSIRQAVETCLSDNAKLVAIAQHNADVAKTRFTAERYNRALLSIIGEAIAGQARPVAATA